MGLDGLLHVTGVARKASAALLITIESAPAPCGRPACGVVAVSHGRRVHQLIDVPAFGRPTRLAWRKRTFSCPDPDCVVGTFTEQDETIAEPRALVSRRACWWAISQIRREHGSVAGMARQLDTAWWSVWQSIKPLLEAMAAEESRFAGVTTLGIDEHIWHHVSIKDRGPKELTGIVGLTRDDQGKVRARLLDLVPGRTGTAYAAWLSDRTQPFRDGSANRHPGPVPRIPERHRR